MTPGMQIISESREAETDRSIWKLILLGILGVLSSTALVFGFNKLLLTLGAVYFWPTALAFTLFLVITVLQVFLVKGLGKLALFAFLESAVPLSFFWGRLYPEMSVTLVAGAALFFIFLFAGMRRGQSVIQNGIKMKFFDTSRDILPKAATGFLLLACVLMFLNYFEWGNFTPAMGREIVTSALLSAEPVVKIIVPGVSFNVTIGELATNLAVDQLRGTKLRVPGVIGSPETDFRSLPKLDQQNLVQKAASQIFGVFESRFGKMDPNEKITDFAYVLAGKYASDSLTNYTWVLPLAVVVVFFTAVKGVLVLFYWFFALLAYLVFKLLVLFGFAYFNLETRSREFILLS